MELEVVARTAELAQANQHLTQLGKIVASSNDAIISLDLNGFINSWNLSAERIFGYTSSEIIGKDLGVLIQDEASRKEFEFAKQSIALTDSQPDFTTAWRTKSGALVSVSVSASPIINSVTERAEGISLIARDNTEKEEAKRRLENSLDEKDVLLREIHHRVKNNLQVISSLLRIQSRYLVDPVALSMFKESEERVRSMALVHDKLYRSQGLNKVEFKSYAEELTKELCRTYALRDCNVETDISINEIEFTIDKAIPCGLILNELISNALKHAFKHASGNRTPCLCISLKTLGSDNERIELIVKDNGSGLPDHVDIKNPDSMGLKVVHTLSEQLGATLETVTNNGTSFRLEFAAEAS